MSRKVVGRKWQSFKGINGEPIQRYCTNGELVIFKSNVKAIRWLLGITPLNIEDESTLSNSDCFESSIQQQQSCGLRKNQRDGS